MGRKSALLTVGAALVAVAALVVALTTVPSDDPVRAAATTGDPGQRATTTTTAPTTPRASAPRQTPVPQQPGPRFEAWVDEVAAWLDIPQRAMHGYALATVRLDDERPDCNLSWVTLAGIGKIATNHGRVNQGKITSDGTASKPIGTIELRGFEGDVVSVPGAAGPMQLSPAVWKANAPGEDARIQDLDDAALAAGRALCADGRDLAAGDEWLAGVSAINDEPLYLHRVLATANVYGTVGQRGQPPNKAALKAVNFAIDKIGLPYVWGGNGEVGFDCSGLTTAAYASAGVELLRTAHWQYGSVPHVPANEEPQLGDLIFFGNPDTKIHHVGIYIGNQQMIDAPTFGQAVQVHNYRKPDDSYAGAGRPAN